MTVRQRLWVAALAVGLGQPALLGGSSALTVLGMRGLDARKVHALVGARHQHRRPPPGVVPHRTRHLPPEDQYVLGRPPCTMPAHSVVDAAQWARSDQDAVAVVAAAFQQRLVGAVDMAPVLARMTHVNGGGSSSRR